MGSALQAYEQCASARTGIGACSGEIWNLDTAREELQAAFGYYLKTCAARLAGRESIEARPS